jgi:hypothetical protein
MVEPQSSANPLFGSYYDIETVPLIVRDTGFFGSTPWEAAKFYQPNALGRAAYGLDVAAHRRPSSENTPLNINTAASYAMLRVADARYDWSNAVQFHRQFFINILGLNPDDTSTDWTTPVGIGNRVGAAIVNHMFTDGMNQLGELDCNYYNGGGFGNNPVTYNRQFNRMNFSDYTCYAPVNEAEKLKSPNRWQPAFDLYDNVTWVVQKMSMPQWSEVETYSGVNINALVSQLPGPKFWPLPAFTQQAVELVDMSANLTDTQKMLAEFFNNKTTSLISTVTFFLSQLLVPPPGSLTKPPIAIMKAVALATTLFQDAGIVSWNVKKTFDAVRPFSAIKFLFRNQNIQAWAQGRGTQTMPGVEWEPYLRTGPFSEYTSTTTCLMYSLLRGIYHLRGDNGSNWNFSITFPKGSSRIEPGITPQTNITVTFATLDDMALASSESRMWGGVHFRSASEHPRTMCQDIADSVYAKWITEMNGDPVLDGV